MKALANMMFPEGVWQCNEEQKVHTPKIASIFALANDLGNKKEPDLSSDSLLVGLLSKSWHLVTDEVKYWRRVAESGSKPFRLPSSDDLPDGSSTSSLGALM